MSKRVALIKDGVVVNVVLVADGWPDNCQAGERWPPPAGHEAATDFAGVVAPGWIHRGRDRSGAHVFDAPPEPKAAPGGGAAAVGE